MRWLSTLLRKPSLDERRGHARLACQFPATCRRQDARFAASIRQLSAGGLRLHLGVRLQPGDSLELHVAERGRLSGMCQVLWCKAVEGGFEAGLCCRQPVPGSWLDRVLQGVGKNSRKHRRFQPEGAVGVLDGLVSPIMDLGMGGASLRTCLHLEEGTLTRLRIAGVELVCSVVGCTAVGQHRYILNLRFLRGQQAASLVLGRLLGTMSQALAA